jgi:hypothetical protein
VNAPPKNSAELSPEPQLPALRFSLRYLLWIVTAVCVVLAALVSISQNGLLAMALLLAVMAVLLHVSGTAIGSRLREHADERRAWEVSRGGRTDFEIAPPVSAARLIDLELRARSPLHGHGRAHHRLRACLVAGAIVGGCLGVVGLTIAMGDRTSPAGIAVGAVSTAVIGAWLAFVAANSWAIFRQGWRDAVMEHGPDEGPRTEQS